MFAFNLSMRLIVSVQYREWTGLIAMCEFCMSILLPLMLIIYVKDTVVKHRMYNIYLNNQLLAVPNDLSILFFFFQLAQDPLSSYGRSTDISEAGGYILTNDFPIRTWGNLSFKCSASYCLDESYLRIYVSTYFTNAMIYTPCQLARQIIWNILEDSNCA
jgi:hypothetical protein